MPASKNTLSNIKKRIIAGRGPILLCNTEEAAEYIGVSRVQIAELCKDGKAPRHYLTGDVVEIYFDADSMEELRVLLRADSAPEATP